MGCKGEPPALTDAVTAERAARLAERAEATVAARGGAAPVYVIGTEVPIPGGALEALDHVEVTEADAARKTIDVHRRAFADRRLEDAFGRVIAAVVQPGVEFGNAAVIVYRPERARALSGVLAGASQLVFEAHSTDYQPRQALRALVEDGFAILKVGPALTFALREALYGLSRIADVLEPAPDRPPLPDGHGASDAGGAGQLAHVLSGQRGGDGRFCAITPSATASATTGRTTRPGRRSTG